MNLSKSINVGLKQGVCALVVALVLPDHSFAIGDDILCGDLRVKNDSDHAILVSTGSNRCSSNSTVVEVLPGDIDYINTCLDMKNHSYGSKSDNHLLLIQDWDGNLLDAWKLELKSIYVTSKYLWDGFSVEREPGSDISNRFYAGVVDPNILR